MHLNDNNNTMTSIENQNNNNINNNNNNTTNSRGFVDIPSLTNESKLNNIIEDGMKTVRISSSSNLNSNIILPVINPIEQSSQQQMILTTKSPNGSPESLPTATSQNGQAITSTSTTGLVRRLSVTARPGDIFYKVKDVTETSSTTDNLSNDSDEQNEVINLNNTSSTKSNNDNKNVIDTIMNSSNNSEEKEIIIKPAIEINKIQQKIASDTSSTSSTNSVDNNTNSSNNRKTTTWNVKRTQINTTDSSNNQMNKQNTALDTSPSLLDSNNLAQLKNNINNTVANIEPGTPKFNKELATIRYIIVLTCFLKI